MQTGDVGSMWNCLVLTLKEDGFRALFQGINSPLLTTPLVNAVVFGAYAHAKTFTDMETHFSGGLLAGAYAGLLNTFVVAPVELVKCRLQVQSHNSHLGLPPRYRSSLHCVAEILRTGGIRELYAGTVATIYREIPAYAGQFAAYEFTKDVIEDVLDLEDEDLPLWASFLAGMMGGLNCWVWSYPQDVIKTHLQVASEPVKGWDGGFYRACKAVYRTQGWRGFWRGFTPCALRAMLANGWGFLAYEYSKKWLGGSF